MIARLTDIATWLRRRLVYIVLTTGIVVVVCLARDPDTRHTIDWGQMPSWATAFIASIALLGVSATFNKWIDDRRDRKLDEANQARLVSPYVSSVDRHGNATTKVFEFTVHTSVANDSGRDIVDARVESVVVTAAIDSAPLTRTFDGDAVPVTIQGRVKPEQKSHESHWTGELHTPLVGWRAREPVISVAIEFTDDNGRRWRRIDRDAPTRVNDHAVETTWRLRRPHKKARGT